MTKQEIETGLKIMIHAMDAVRDAGKIGSGVLYAALMNHLSKAAYDQMIVLAVKTGLIRQENDMLIWIA